MYLSVFRPSGFLYVSLIRKKSCEFSMSLKKNGDTVYEDALFNLNCDQTIGAFYRGLESKYHGTIIDFYYGGYADEVFAKEVDMDMNMTLLDLFVAHGQKEEGAFYVKISTKYDKETGKRLAELNKQWSELQKQSNAILQQIRAIEEGAAKPKTRRVLGGSRRKSRKHRRS